MNFVKTKQLACPICKSKNITFHHKRSDDRYGYTGQHHIAMCKKCTALFLADPVSSMHLGKLYELYYPSLEKQQTSLLHTLAHKVPILLSLFRKITGSTTLLELVPKGSKVLDVGCGYYPELVQEIAHRNLKWSGLEVNSDIVTELNKAGLTCYLGTPQACKITDKFEYILLSQVIEHQLDVVDNINALKKYLKQDGKIILLTPSSDSRFLSRYGKKWLHWHTPYHTVIFNKKSIYKLSQICGLTVEKYSTYTPAMWHVLQHRFKLQFGRRNSSLAAPISMLDLLIPSLYLKVTDSLNYQRNDCMFCVLKKI